MDLINTLRIILEQSTEFKTPLYLAFIDFEKAFNSIHRSAIWRLMREYGIPEKIIRIIREAYDDYECLVEHQNKLTNR